MRIYIFSEYAHNSTGAQLFRVFNACLPCSRASPRAILKKGSVESNFLHICQHISQVAVGSPALSWSPWVRPRACIFALSSANTRNHRICGRRKWTFLSLRRPQNVNCVFALWTTPRCTCGLLADSIAHFARPSLEPPCPSGQNWIFIFFAQEFLPGWQN